MNKALPTPGPWTVHVNHSAASFTVFDEHGNFGDTDCDTLDANARLIAASPDLLAALNHVAKCGRGTSGRLILETDDEEIVLAAISRATGESS